MYKNRINLYINITKIITDTNYIDHYDYISGYTSKARYMNYNVFGIRLLIFNK
jgi:hypothetical protein